MPGLGYMKGGTDSRVIDKVAKKGNKESRKRKKGTYDKQGTQRGTDNRVQK